MGVSEEEGGLRVLCTDYDFANLFVKQRREIRWNFEESVAYYLCACFFMFLQYVF